MLGLYLHVPFCSSICNYCNFNRGLFDPGLKERYVRALEEEIRGSGRGEPVDTIYFGGGTPSLLDPAEIAGLVSLCREVFRVVADVEITLETNPETSTPERMREFREAGVNRVSFGVQSLSDVELARLGRVHSAARARAAFEEARGAGFDNISLDFMMWLPQQSVGNWAANVDGAIALGPEHLSLYILELYPNAPLKDDMARAGWSLAPDEDAADMYLRGLSALEAAGYQQYEISNVARMGRTSRHNLKYWTDGEWLGFGCGARWKNVSSTTDYIDRIFARQPVGIERRDMTRDEQLSEALFTGLRLTKGVDLQAVGRRYETDVWGRYGAELQMFVDVGVLCREAEHLRLTREGMLVANEVMQVFV